MNVAHPLQQGDVFRGCPIGRTGTELLEHEAAVAILRHLDVGIGRAISLQRPQSGCEHPLR